MLVSSSSVHVSSRATTQGSIKSSIEGQVNPANSSALVKPWRPNTSLSTPTSGAARNWTTAARVEGDAFMQSVGRDVVVLVNLSVGGPGMAMVQEAADWALSMRLSVHPIVGLTASSLSLSSMMEPLILLYDSLSLRSLSGAVCSARYSVKDIDEDEGEDEGEVLDGLSGDSPGVGEGLLLCVLCSQHIASALEVLSLHSADRRSCVCCVMLLLLLLVVVVEIEEAMLSLSLSLYVLYPLSKLPLKVTSLSSSSINGTALYTLSSTSFPVFKLAFTFWMCDSNNCSIFL